MTVEELKAEIAEINTALSQIRKGGQSYMIMTASGGGTQRSATMADYERLKNHRDDLQRELDSKTAKRGVIFKPGW